MRFAFLKNKYWPAHTWPGYAWLALMCSLCLALCTSNASGNPPSSTAAPATPVILPPPADEDFGFAEPYFDTVDDAKTLPAVITALAQDSYGWLWIGTTSGLFRFDGYHFHKFVHDDNNPGSLAGNSITALWPGQDGRLWVGTISDGLSVLAPGSEHFNNLRHDPSQAGSIAGGRIWALMGDSAGGVWIGTNEGLDYAPPGAGPLQHYKQNKATPGSLIDNRIRSLLIDKQGTLWIGSFAGLQRHRKGSLNFEGVASAPSDPTSMADKNIQALFQAQDGKLWIGTGEHGVAWLSEPDLAPADPNENKLHWLPLDRQHPDRLSHGWVSRITQPEPEQIWLSTQGGGINIVSAKNGKVLQRLQHDPANPTSLAHNSISTLMIDHSGLLWVGTWGAGLQRYQPAQRAFRVLRQSPAHPNWLSHSDVHSVLELSDGRILVGSDGNGIDILDRRRGLIGGYRPQPGQPGSLQDGVINALTQTPDGTLWAGTRQAGAARLTPGSQTWQTYTSEQGLPAALVSAFLVTRDGTLWVATNSGIARWLPTKQRFEVARLDDGSAMHADVATMAEDAQGRLWIASSTGLWVKTKALPGLKVILHDEKHSDSLSTNSVTGLLVDNSNRLWVATNKGLDRLTSWDGQRAVFEHINAIRKSGESDSSKLMQDLQGRIWISKDWVLDPKTLRITNNLTPTLGAQWRGANARTRDGLLMYGGRQGLAVFNPAKFSTWNFQPPIRATALKINGKSVPAGILASKLTLLSGQRSFSIEFSALDFLSPKNNRYLYRLQNYDHEWIETDSEHRNATYSNLWPGQYTLQVKGSNGLEEWSDQELSIQIEILPAFWQTKWFAALVFLILGGSVWRAWLWRIAHHHKQAQAKAQELQTLVDVRTAEALSAHSQLALARQLEQTRSQMLQQEKMAALGTLTAGVAHEINNPTNFTHVAAQIQRTNLTEFQQFLMNLLDEEAESKVVAEFTRRFSQLQDYVSTMLEGTERIKTIVNDLRAFSRRERAEKKAVHLSECLISTLNLVRTNWGGQIEFITEFTDDPLYECWPTLLNQVFMNLMVNGCHAIAAKQKQNDSSDLGHLWLRLRRQDEKLIVEIEDDGCGIDPEVRERILEPFFTTKDIDAGTGLGLSIANGIIQKHFGTLEITSTPGQGSCFAVHLPYSN